ncbi:trehalase family glycosidase [Sphingomonas sp. BK345]|uniref:trehalase family glycosidase n=1 Tax=Sphingomonas sp. BK345 TaxID=2586980 RepID=UPI0017952954|nr:trehalase family glycosidase [Sphingomonas sp. BK345]MBB3472249.1 alpha,alpha-trehalase [Sphingomonas sp. BK345]
MRGSTVAAAALMLALLPAVAAAQTAASPAASAIPAATRAYPASPAELFGALFDQVQRRRLFPDGKTFADATPKRSPAAIMADYARAGALDDGGLRAFVLANFDVPEPGRTAPPSAARPRLAEHIRALWPQLTRPPLSPPPGSSALALPHRYVVPGGRFREMYYWDSYFTMLGLEADGQRPLTRDMIENFVSLVERYGHVPNGTRTYYVTRSQPPFLYLMMGLVRDVDRTTQARWLDALLTEHRFWIEQRSATMPDGARLQHYGDGKSTPRDESYREDVATGEGDPRVYKDLRAGAESGWDYSSRWFGDGRTLATIDTTKIVPADLNSLLYGMERAIAARCRALARPCAATFERAATTRQRAIERWLWSERDGRYGDYDLATARLRAGVTAATAYPLFTDVASRTRGARVAQTIERDLLAANGLRTTAAATGQQWDKPNGWAPLQWVAVEGLRRYGAERVARQIGTRFLATVEREYRASGKLLEKYDVEESRAGGGGEYPTQDGFGWTNGVTRALQQRYGQDGQ